MSGLGTVYSVISIGSRRQLGRGIAAQIAAVIAVATSLYHLYVFTLGAGKLDMIYQHRTTHLTLILVLAFLCYSFSPRPGRRLPIPDIVMAVLSVAVWGYIFLNYQRILDRAPMADPVLPLDIVFGILLILLIFEAARRVVGLPLVLVALVFIVYMYFGQQMPGMWRHSGFSTSRIVDSLFLSQEGIWGFVLGVSSTYIFLFVLFGQFLLQLGGGEFFTDLARAVAGRQVGGPAKVAVVASALFGTVSGSAAANVATTGSFTIPMMKSLGYRPTFAGAVEVAASTGGMITPPVMAATVFLMSEMTGIPYIQIVIASILPATFYYLTLGLQVHFEAVKRGLKPLPAEEIPQVAKVLKEGWQFFLPFVVIITFLVAGYSPIRAALWGIAATVVAALIAKRSRQDIGRKIWASLEQGAKSAVVVAASCAVAGVIMGAIFTTGLGGKFSSAVLALSGGNLLPALLMAMLGCLLLGLALSAPAAYILTAILIAPAAISLGVSEMAAHLFAIYFAIIAQITPPAGAGIFVAGALAGANPMMVGFTACRLAAVGFVIPFMFVYNPALLMAGTPVQIILAALTAIIGFLALASGLEGWLLGATRWWERVLLVGGGLSLVYPGLMTDSVGIGMLLLILTIQVTRYGLVARFGAGRAS